MERLVLSWVENLLKEKKAFHIDSEGYKILVPYAWYKDGEVEALKKSS